MKTLAQRRNLATSVLCALGLTLAVASGAHAATPVSDLARLDGSTARVGNVDPYLDAPSSARWIRTPTAPAWQA